MKSKDIAEKMQKAINHATAQENDQAREIFDDLLELDTEDYQIDYNAGIFYSQIGEHPRAAELLMRALHLQDSLEIRKRLIMEHLHIGGGRVFQTDFMAWDVAHLEKAESLIEEGLTLEPQDSELKALKDKVHQRRLKEKVAVRFMQDELEFCRKTLSRKKELTDLDQRVQGFLNLLDTGEYTKTKGEFAVLPRSDIPDGPREGFLERIRNYVLGK